MYDVEKLYVEKESLDERGLAKMICLSMSKF